MAKKKLQNPIKSCRAVKTFVDRVRALGKRQVLRFQNSTTQQKVSMMTSWDWGIHPNPRMDLEHELSVLGTQSLSSYGSVQIVEENCSEFRSRRNISGLQPVPRENSLHFLESREREKFPSRQRNSSISFMSASQSENQAPCILDTQVNLVELLQANPIFMKSREMTGQM